MKKNVLELSTDKALLEALKRAASTPVGPEERLEQRVSFVYGQLGANSTVARDRVRQIIIEQQGGAAGGISMTEPVKARTPRDISDDARKLEAERRDEMKRAMAQYDADVYGPTIKALREECGGLGHAWHFTHYGPTYMSWYRCGRCGKAEARDE